MGTKAGNTFLVGNNLHVLSHFSAGSGNTSLSGSPGRGHVEVCTWLVLICVLYVFPFTDLNQYLFIFMSHDPE